ncbi:DNA excision repair protein ERCC-6 [Clonorchis sinensis]|uniref:DNA excision repair protein ERCC-6 n=2 Tax=Clonorchis sinensis TaxID=79923 RepID=A0A8T1M6S5_CLOSI|nr:DNA excision repair protein ERCC-6 [Clonorchis sinensis]
MSKTGKAHIIDKAQIPATINDETDTLPNVIAYKQLEFEAGVLHQAANAFQKHVESEASKTRHRLLSLEDDLKFANSHLENMEHTLDTLLTQSTSSSGEITSSRRIRSLELEIENKMKQIDVLNSRKQSLLSKLSMLQDTSLSDQPNLLAYSQTTESSMASLTTAAPVSKPTLPEHKRKDPPTIVRCTKSPPVKKIRLPKKPIRTIKKLDDANLEQFQKRLRRQRHLDALERQLAKEHGEDPDPVPPDGQLDKNFLVPGRIWSRLFEYQRTGVNWLWQLHQKQSGGILGDEMGLGKTIQIIAFLAGLHYSEFLVTGKSGHLGPGPSHRHSTGDFASALIVCPATVLQQWLREFHQWYPAMRVAILHSTGSGYQKPNSLIRSMGNHPGSVLLTTYQTLVTYQDVLTAVEPSWTYLILDEGHKIKNPEAEVTHAVKRFATSHRLILSGSPMQNNLRELWSLFDFVSPGRLGPLPEFMQQFAIPITQGGYASASPLQVETAYRCACTLRDLLMPFLIRRLKTDVQIQLPAKSEQVLFCRLTNYQRQLYREFAESQLCKDLLNGKGNVFTALILLRKLCNHPDLVTGGPRDHILLGDELPEDDVDVTTVSRISEYGWTRFGCPRRSSKMLVVASLLRTWSTQGHKVLLFSQSRRMLCLLERLLITLGITYLRMDGSTPVSQRPALIDRFNRSTDSSAENIFVFLLTTRVGGLGINLTAANRVLIFDPDWNPMTDLQARERAWRIGQTQDVIIYRLLTSGTIEEKIYHRQIFKQFLTNRVLKNPRQQRFFKTNDLQELLSFDDGESASRKKDQAPETAKYVHCEGLGHTVLDASKSVIGNPKIVNRFDLLQAQGKVIVKETTEDETDSDDSHEEEIATTTADAQQTSAQPLRADEARKAQLRQLARELSKRIGEGRLNEDKPLKLRSKLRLKHPQRRGTRVDGKRIPLISRRAVYDCGDVDTTPSPGHSKDSRCEKLLPIADETSKDVFLTTLLVAPDGVASAELQSSMKVKRSILDEELRAEAERVATEALIHIQRYSSSKTCKDLTSTTEPGTSCSMPTSSKHTAPMDSDSCGIFHAKRDKNDKPTSSDNVQASEQSRKRKVVHSASRPKNSTPHLSHVSHVLLHDQLIDDFTQESRIDHSFYTSEARHLAEVIAEELLREAQTSFDPQAPEANLPTSVLSTVRPFGLVHNRFLWNPSEHQSPALAYLSHSLRQNALSSQNTGIKSFDPRQQSPLDASAVLVGHVRFSSSILLQLISVRHTARQSFPATTHREPSHARGSIQHQMQVLCCELIRILTGSSLTVTSGFLASCFNHILCKNSDSVNDLNALHFRAILRRVAGRRRAKDSSTDASSRCRYNDVWFLRERYRDIAQYLSNQLASCERSST